MAVRHGGMGHVGDLRQSGSVCVGRDLSRCRCDLHYAHRPHVTPPDVQGWRPRGDPFDEGPVCARALATPTSRPPVPLRHRDCASDKAIPESIRRRSRSQSSWTCSDMAVRGQSAAPHGWTGSTEQLAQDLQAGLVRQTALHDRCRSCSDRQREWQPPARLRSSRGDHCQHPRLPSWRVVC